jgi:ribosomal protein L29
MANSFVRYTGDGNTTSYSIPFSYRSTADLTITLAGVASTAFTLNAAGTTLTFNSAPANGTAIEIRRRTSQGSKLVDYASGSVLTENDLDTDSEQAFFMSQEAIDDAGDVIKIDNTNFQWDTQNKRLTNVADPVNNNDAVNKQFLGTNLPNITTVAGISSDVTTVAGISSNVTTVANDTTDIGTVATNIASVNTVATNIADVVTVANDLNEAISEIETAANDLNEATSEIDTVSNNIANVNTVGTNISNVNTVAGISANVTTVAGDSADIQTLAAITNLGTLASNATNINTVATNIANVNTVAGNNTNINTVAGNNANISTVAGISSDVTSVAGVAANVTTVAGISSNVTAVANDATDIGTVATNIANVNSVGGSIANVNSVASNLSGVNSFAERYRILSSAPSTSNDVGDLYFDTTANELKVYKSSGWAAAGSTVNGTANRFEYTATAGQTTFTGADANGATMAYDAGFIDVYLNGVKLANADFTATSGTSVILASGASVNDILMVVAYGTFQLANVSINDLTDTPAAIGTAGQALVVNSGGTALEYANASSAEVYGFEKYFSPSTINVSVTASGGIFYINGVQQDTLELLEGNTYVFSYPSSHPFALSTTANGTHGGGSEYTTGVTRDTSANTLTYVVPTDAPQLYYYCTSHSNMGGTANTPVPALNSLRVRTTNQGVDNITASQYANFKDVLFSASGFTFSLNSNGELIATI